MKHTKIAIIGAGAVGSTTAYALMLKNIAAEIILVDINESRCKGEILDLSDALSFCNTSKIKTSSIKNIKNPDIIIITAGVAQKSGQTRSDLVVTNKKIVTSIIEDLKPLDKNTIIIVVTNPVDAMTFYAQQASGLPYNQVFGSGTLLDSQRLCGFIAEKLQVAQQSIHAYILGQHGDSQFPAWSSAHVAGKPLTDFSEIKQKDLDQFAQKTREKVYEIIKYKGATFFGIATCVAMLCEAIVFNQKRIVPVSTFVKQFGLYLSLPVVLGCKSIEQIIEVPLNEIEKKQLDISAKIIQETIDMA